MTVASHLQWDHMGLPSQRAPGIWIPVTRGKENMWCKVLSFLCNSSKVLEMNRGLKADWTMVPVPHPGTTMWSFPVKMASQNAGTLGCPKIWPIPGPRSFWQSIHLGDPHPASWDSRPWWCLTTPISHPSWNRNLEAFGGEFYRVPHPNGSHWNVITWIWIWMNLGGVDHLTVPLSKKQNNGLSERFRTYGTCKSTG